MAKVLNEFDEIYESIWNPFLVLITRICHHIDIIYYGISINFFSEYEYTEPSEEFFK